MKNKLKKIFAFALALAMAFSCYTVAYATEVEKNVKTSAVFVSEENGIMPLADQVVIAMLNGSVGTSEYTGSFSIPWSILGTKYIPYFNLSPGNETFAVYIAIYKNDGSRVVGITYNTVNGNLAGKIRLGNVELSSGKYTYKIVFDRPIQVVSLNLYANPA